MSRSTSSGAFADAAGLAVLGFQGDHYDVPDGASCAAHRSRRGRGRETVSWRGACAPAGLRLTLGAAAGPVQRTRRHPRVRSVAARRGGRGGQVDVVTDDEPLDQLDTEGRRQVVLHPRATARSRRPAHPGRGARSPARARARPSWPLSGPRGGEALGHLDGVVGGGSACRRRSRTRHVAHGRAGGRSSRRRVGVRS